MQTGRNSNSFESAGVQLTFFQEIFATFDFVLDKMRLGHSCKHDGTRFVENSLPLYFKTESLCC